MPGKRRKACENKWKSPAPQSGHSHWKFTFKFETFLSFLADASRRAEIQALIGGTALDFTLPYQEAAWKATPEEPSSTAAAISQVKRNWPKMIVVKALARNKALWRINPNSLRWLKDLTESTWNCRVRQLPEQISHCPNPLRGPVDGQMCPLPCAIPTVPVEKFSRHVSARHRDVYFGRILGRRVLRAATRCE